MPLYELDGVRPELPASGNYWIAPDAVLIGKVKLEEGASVWFGAVLRGDNEPILIGAKTNIQDGAVLHTDPGYPCIVGPNCTIGHNAIVHGCTVGESCLIGMGATLMNGSTIGAHSVVGAHALVSERKQFAEGLLVIGAPAKVIRSLDEKSVLMANHSAESYFKRWQKYDKELRAV
jgi:carbonic anhydrase/acetyltransferase-like protein (isoleucine patch superfamily)